jgi:hypothetical protein
MVQGYSKAQRTGLYSEVGHTESLVKTGSKAWKRLEETEKGKWAMWCVNQNIQARDREKPDHRH